MSPFFETILIKDGRAPFLKWHNLRATYTKKRFFSSLSDIDFSNIYFPKNATFRLKVYYSKKIDDFEIYPYIFTKKKRLRIVESVLNYSYKSTNREDLNNIFLKRDGCCDSIIVKNGFITDTTIANIALYKDGIWFTPTVPLLKGTTRARLISSNFLIPKQIEIDTIFSYSKIALMNGLSGFYILGNVENVVVKG